MKNLILLAVTFLLIQNTFSQSIHIDSSFGINGVAYTTLNNCLAVQQDGKLVISGSNNLLSRYNRNGSRDSSFGNNGVQTSPISISSIAIQKDGKIVAGGFAGNYPHYDFAIGRFNSNGTIDSTFSYNGVHIINFKPGDNYANAAAIQSNGKIFLAGYAYLGGNYNFALARFNVNGSLDTSFSRDGKVTTDFSQDERAYSMTLQSDGKIILAGSTGIEHHSEEIALARYYKDGSLDSTFSKDGKFTSGFPEGFGDYEPRCLAIQSDGKIVVAGNFYTHTDHLFLARYNFNGTADNTFSEDGILIPDSSYGYANVAIAIQPDGKILLGGRTSDGNNEDMWLGRYNPNGSIDKYFGKEGVKTIDLFYTDASVTGLAISNNQVYVLGNQSEISFISSPIHLQSYLDEYVFQFNHRNRRPKYLILLPGK